MERFSALYEELASTNLDHAKVEALTAYFRGAAPEDAAWAVFFLTGQRIKRLVSSATLRAWAGRRANLPAWLVAEAHAVVGDSAETAALLVDAGARRHQAQRLPFHRWLEERILPLRSLSAEAQYQQVCAWWEELPRSQVFVLNKLLCATLRAEVSAILLARALSSVSGVPESCISSRLRGRWQADAACFRALIAPQGAAEKHARPYPFLLASPLEEEPQSLGNSRDWVAEWKWDGIRAQLIRRGGEVFLWSREDELITEGFPEITAAAAGLPDEVAVDGEILAWGEGGAQPFAALRARLTRERPTKRLLQPAPVRFMAYDLLAIAGEDLRGKPFFKRRARLEALLHHVRGLELAPTFEVASWEELAALRARAQARHCKGLILKRRDDPYGADHERGAWWTWEAGSRTIDAVLVYAQSPGGRRSCPFTEYTFGLWNGDALVPVAKTSSGLSEREAADLDRWIRRHTVKRFGPVRSVEPLLVFELAFAGVSPSSRHKSGLILLSPRIVQWRRDRTAREAGSLADLGGCWRRPHVEPSRPATRREGRARRECRGLNRYPGRR